MCLIFAAIVDFRPPAPAYAALVCICVSICHVLFSLPFYLSPFVISLTLPLAMSLLASGSDEDLSSQLASVLAGRHVLRHISPGLCINFSSLPHSHFHRTINTLSRFVRVFSRSYSHIILYARRIKCSILHIILRDTCTDIGVWRCTRV